MPNDFSITRRVQFAETDMAGVMHFSNYLRWMEDIEHSFYRSLGLSVMMHHEGTHLGWPRVSAACDYSKPARFEDELEMRFRVVKVGGKSFGFEVHFLHGKTRIAIGRMTSVCCAMTPDGFKPITIPASIRSLLEAHLVPPTAAK